MGMGLAESSYRGPRRAWLRWGRPRTIIPDVRMGIAGARCRLRPPETQWRSWRHIRSNRYGYFGKTELRDCGGRRRPDSRNQLPSAIRRAGRSSKEVLKYTCLRKLSDLPGMACAP